ncbi:MAG: hypothetical protein CSA24_02685 [Deltaproteobacteria bacterium]|nr:MAG: hypothetical protein CSA24_02685 [Deltaproteobacteria bacterium]
MEFAHILFWLLAFGAVVTSLLVVLPRGRNPLYGALALIVSFVFMAGIYVLLVAHAMAVLQILVYAGAIMVLFTFVIMLLNLTKKELADESKTVAQGLGAVAMLFIAVKAIVVIEASAHQVPAGRESFALAGDFGTIEQVGEHLFKDYLVSFELTGVLLLVAVIGAVVLAKRTL